MADSDSTDAHAAKLLGGASLRSTPVRRAILALLMRSPQSLDVPGLLAKLPKHTDAVTVYRTLNTFVRKKMVHRVRGEERSWRYAIGQHDEGTKHQHPHFVCGQCGRVECLAESQVPPTLSKALKVGSDYVIDYTEVIVHGSCAKCH